MAHLNQEKAISNSSGTSRRGSALAAQGVNVATHYIENKDSEAIDGFHSTTIRNKAHQLFVDIANQGLAPAMWGQAGSIVTDGFNNEMCRHFLEFWLCTTGWKAQYLATQIYPTWFVTHKKQINAKAQVKVEVISDVDDASVASTSAHSKCSRQETANPVTSKKSKNTHGKAKEMIASPLAAQISQL